MTNDNTNWIAFNLSTNKCHIGCYQLVTVTTKVPAPRGRRSVITHIYMYMVQEKCSEKIWQMFFFNTCDQFVTWGYSQHELLHDDVIKWKHFPRYWPFVRGILRSPVKSPHKGKWRGALMFSLICAWINGWVNNGEAGNLGRHRKHYEVTVM